MCVSTRKYFLLKKMQLFFSSLNWKQYLSELFDLINWEHFSCEYKCVVQMYVCSAQSQFIVRMNKFILDTLKTHVQAMYGTVIFTVAIKLH